MYFGRKPNRIRNKLFLRGKKEYEVLEENNSSFKTGDSKKEELLELEIERGAIRQEAPFFFFFFFFFPLFHSSQIQQLQHK